MELFAVGAVFFGITSFVKWFSCESFAGYAVLMIICLLCCCVSIEKEAEAQKKAKTAKPVKYKATEAVKMAVNMKFESRK